MHIPPTTNESHKTEGIRISRHIIGRIYSGLLVRPSGKRLQCAPIINHNLKALQTLSRICHLGDHQGCEANSRRQCLLAQQPRAGQCSHILALVRSSQITAASVSIFNGPASYPTGAGDTINVGDDLIAEGEGSMARGPRGVPGPRQCSSRMLHADTAKPSQRAGPPLAATST